MFGLQIVLRSQRDMQPFHISVITNNLIQNLSIIIILILIIIIIIIITIIIIHVKRVSVLFSFI